MAKGPSKNAEFTPRRGTSESRSVAEDFRRGNPAAVEEVTRRVGRILLHRAVGLDQADRKDLEQEAMTQLWRMATQPSFDSGAGFWALVELVTVRRCIDRLRTQKSFEPIDPATPAAGRSPLARTLDQEQSRLATAAIARLAEPCQRLIRLRVQEGKSYREIGGLLGKSESSIRVQLYRCIRRAQKELHKLRAC